MCVQVSNEIMNLEMHQKGFAKYQPDVGFCSATAIVSRVMWVEMRDIAEVKINFECQ
jgi:hypothetical protein